MGHMAILCLAFLRNCQTVFGILFYIPYYFTFCPVHTILYSHQQCMKVIISLYPHKLLLFLVLHCFICDGSHPTGIKMVISLWF